MKEKKEKKMVLGKSQEDRIRLHHTYKKRNWYVIADGWYHAMGWKYKDITVCIQYNAKHGHQSVWFVLLNILHKIDNHPAQAICNRWQRLWLLCKLPSHLGVRWGWEGIVHFSLISRIAGKLRFSHWWNIVQNWQTNMINKICESSSLKVNIN